MMYMYNNPRSNTHHHQQQELPYVCGSSPIQDGRFIAAQVISVFALLMSWNWWLTLALGVAVFVPLQVAWCCKLDRTGIKAVAGVSLLNSAVAFFAGAYAMVEWRHFKGKDNADRQCPIFYVFGNKSPDAEDSFTYDASATSIQRFDGCNEVAYTIIFGIMAILHILIAYFLARFVNSPESKLFYDNPREQTQTHIPTSAVPVFGRSVTVEMPQGQVVASSTATGTHPAGTVDFDV